MSKDRELPPPPYESIAGRGGSVRHVYLTPGSQPEGASDDGYLEPAVRYTVPRDSGLYSSIDENGTYSDTENVPQEIPMIHYITPLPPKTPTAPAHPPPTPVGGGRQHCCLICAVLVCAFVGIVILACTVSVVMVFYVGNKQQKSAILEHEIDRSTNPQDGILDTCNITENGAQLASPSTSDKKYSCNKCPVSGCASEVHVIAMYEPEGSVREFQQRPDVVPVVPVDITATTPHLPLTLVLSSYEATNWEVKLEEGISISHVFLMSYYQSDSSVTVLLPYGTQTRNYTTHPSSKYVDYKGTPSPAETPYENGCSRCQGVDEVSTMTSPYGCFTSFSGAYRASSWNINLNEVNCN